MSKIPVTPVVDVTISVSGAGASIDRFGVPMIVDTQNIQNASALAPVVSTFYSLREMVAAGFASYTKAYKLAAQMLRQKAPRPKFWKVASVDALSDAELTAVEDADPAWYYLQVTTVDAGEIEDVSGWVQSVATQGYAYLCDSFDADNFGTGPSIKTLLASADAIRTFLVCRVAKPQTQTLTISAPFVASNSTVITVNGTPITPVVFATNSNTTLAALATALQATDAIASATVVDAGGGTDDDRTIIIVADDPLVDVVLTGYACSLGASQNTAAIATTDAGASVASASAVGYLCRFAAGAASIGLKTFSGIDGDALSQTQATRAKSFGANVYTEIGGVDVLWNGNTSGEIAPGAFYFLDTLIATDRLKAEIEAAVYAALRADPKTPYTQNGINAVVGAMVSVAQQFVAQGILLPFDPATAVNTPTLASIPAQDRTARHLPGITAEFVGAGAIQSANIQITVTE